MIAIVSEGPPRAGGQTGTGGPVRLDFGAEAPRPRESPKEPGLGVGGPGNRGVGRAGGFGEGADLVGGGGDGDHGAGSMRRIRLFEDLAGAELDVAGGTEVAEAFDAAGPVDGTGELAGQEARPGGRPDDPGLGVGDQGDPRRVRSMRSRASLKGRLAARISGVWKPPPMGRASTRLAPAAKARRAVSSTAADSPEMTTWPGALELARNTLPTWRRTVRQSWPTVLSGSRGRPA